MADGDRSGARVFACCSMISIGSVLSLAGAHSPWLERGTSARAAFPAAARSSGDIDMAEGALTAGLAVSAVDWVTFLLLEVGFPPVMLRSNR